jgi:hypothetical protein
MFTFGFLVGVIVTMILEYKFNFIEKVGDFVIPLLKKGYEYIKSLFKK